MFTKKGYCSYIKRKKYKIKIYNYYKNTQIYFVNYVKIISGLQRMPGYS